MMRPKFLSQKFYRGRKSLHEMRALMVKHARILELDLEEAERRQRSHRHPWGITLEEILHMETFSRMEKIRRMDDVERREEFRRINKIRRMDEEDENLPFTNTGIFEREDEFSLLREEWDRDFGTVRDIYSAIPTLSIHVD